jgi:hypothetical protein
MSSLNRAVEDSAIVYVTGWEIILGFWARRRIYCKIGGYRFKVTLVFKKEQTHFYNFCFASQ